jgi:hypothetical protein
MAPVLDYRAPGRSSFSDNDPQINAALLEYVKQRRIPTVLIVGYWDLHFGRDPEFSGALLRTVRTLQEQDVTVYLMQDVPNYTMDVPRFLVRCCSQGIELSATTIDCETYRTTSLQQLQTIRLLQQEGVRILDPLPYLQAQQGNCRLRQCDAEGSFYADSHHLSAHGAEVISPVFDSMFEEIRDSQLTLPVGAAGQVNAGAISHFIPKRPPVLSSGGGAQ